MEEVKHRGGPRRCKACGGVMPRGNRVRANYCIACLREMTEAPPYPCTDCPQCGNAECMRHLNLRACEDWTDWAMVTWRLTVEQLKKSVEERRPNNGDSEARQ